MLKSLKFLASVLQLNRQVAGLRREVEDLRFSQVKVLQGFRYGCLQRPRSKSLNQFEFRVFSQNGEDGIILEILRRIGSPTGYFIEVGIQDGKECNSANLAINFGWNGLMLEGDEGYARSAREYYREMAGHGAGEVTVAHEFVTAINFESLLRSNGVRENIDVLSIDVDGVDYWLWDCLSEMVRPRLVVMEYNAYLPVGRAITVPYDPAFSRYQKHASGYFFGASLKALSNLANKKGYSLVACDSRGANAFFVANEFIKGNFQPISPEDAYFPLTSGTKKRPKPHEAFALIEHMTFVEV